MLPSDIQEIAGRLAEPVQDLAGKTVLLTGGRGFLGRYFTEVILELNRTVLKEPCRLVVVDNLITAGESGSGMPDLPNVTFLKRDVIHPMDWEGPLDYVIHAAGIASPFYYRAYPLETLEVAITGTRNMLEFARRHHARFTFFSSSEIYGDPDSAHVPTPESYRGQVSCQGPRALRRIQAGRGDALLHLS